MKRWTRQIVSCLTLMMVVGLVMGQQPQESPEDLLYRLIKVEEADLDEVLPGTIPVLRTQFEAMAEAINSRVREQSAGQPEFRQGAYVRRSMYYGRVEGLHIVDGRAVLGVDAQEQSEGVVPLAPLSIAIESPEWVMETMAEPEAGNQAAVTGVSDRNVPVLKVQGPGDLTFNWSLKGTAVVETERKFVFDVPQSESGYLVLDLPQELLLKSSSGIVWAPQQDTLPLPVDGLPELAAEQNRWVVQLGSQANTTLTVLTDDAEAPSANVLFYSQEIQYSVEPEGIQVESRLTLDSVLAQRQSVSLQLAPELELVGISNEGRDLAISKSHAGQNHWTVTLDPRGGTLELDVIAVARILPLQPQVLPLISVVDGIWRQGQIALTVAESLELYRLDIQGAIESRVEQVGAMKRRVLEMYEPTPKLVIVTGHQEAEIHASQVSRYEMDRNQLYLQTKISLTAATQPVHQQHFEVINGWELQAVTLEAFAGGAEQITPRVSDVKTQTAVLKQIEFMEAIEPGNTLVLNISMSKQISGLQVDGVMLPALILPNQSESPLQQKRVVLQQHLIGLTAKPPRVLALSGLGDTRQGRLNPGSEEIAEEALLRDVGIVFRAASYLNEIQIASVPATQSFESQLQTVIHVSDSVTETTRLKVTPLGTPVKQIQIVSTGLSGEDVQWQLVPSGSPTLTSDGILNIVKREVDGTQHWTIELVEPSVTEFTLLGSREIAVSQFSRLPLYRIEGTQAYAAAIEIGWDSDLQLSISDEPTLEQVLPEQNQGPWRRFRQAYHYGTPVGTPPQVEIVKADVPVEHIVWNAHVHSKYLVHGFSSHEVRYLVECLSDEDLQVTLPSGVDLESVWVDEQRMHLASLRIPNSPSQLLIPLKTGLRFAKIRIRFTASAATLGFRTQLQKPLPVVQAKTLQSYWSVAVPPGFELANHSTEYSIAQRLLGPWLNQASRKQSPVGRNSDAEQAYERTQSKVTALIERAAIIRRGELSTESLTWSQWLHHIQILLEDEFGSVQLAVDVVALDSVGIDPLTQISSEMTIGTGMAAMQWLRESGLAFVLDDDRLFLTSDRWVEQSDSNPSRVVVVDDHSRPVFATYKLAGGSVVTLTDWILGRQVLSLLSQQEVRQLHETLRKDLMWTYDSGVEKVQQGVSLIVYNKASLLTASWASLLIWFGVLLWLCRRNWRIAFLLPGLSGSLAMFLSTEFVAFGAQAFVASLAVMVCTIFARLQTKLELVSKDKELDFDLQARPGILTSVLFFAMLLGTADLVSALQPPASESNSDESNQQDNSPASEQEVMKQLPVIHNVYFPVDSEGAAAGQYLYVADSFYQTLRKWHAGIDKTEESWLISKADYRVEWESEEQDQNSIRPLFQIQYDIELGEETQHITLPLSEDESFVESVSIEGESVAFQWLDEAGGLQVETQQAGNVTVLLQLRPVVSSQDGISRIQLGIPAVPQSRLETTPFSDEQKILLSGSRGQIRTDSLNRRQVASIGNTDRIGVIWGMGDVEIAGVSVLESAEYYWLKIAPHSVVLDVRLKVDVVAGTTQQFSMNIDPRLRLLPIRSGQILSGAPRIRDGETKTLYFSLQRPVSDSFELQLSFYLEDISGIGNVPIPEISPVVQRRRERWLALNVEDDLTWHSALKPISAEQQQDVLANWTTSMAPQAIYALTGDTQGLEESITTLPRVVATEVTQSTDVVVDQDQLLMLYHADLLIEDGVVFQHRFDVPAGFIVESATMIQDGAVIAADVQHIADGILSVFTDEGVAGELTFDLRGRIPIRSSSVSTVNVPAITYENGMVIEDSIVVVQRPGVVVRAHQGQEQIETEAKFIEDLGGRLIAEFDAAVKARECKLKIAPNHVELRGVASGGLEEVDGQWQFNIYGDLEVVQGEVSQLQIQVKDIQFSSIESVLGAYALETQQYAEDDYLITLRPSEVMPESVSFQLRFDLEQTDGILAVPDFTIVRSAKSGLRQFFYMPLMLEGQHQLEWDATGAQKISQWSTDIIPSSVTVQTHAVYLGTGNVDIRSRGFVQSASQLQVELVNYELAVIDQQQIVGLARIDVLPTRGKELQLVWPEMWVLESISIQGTPVLAKRLELPSAIQEENSRVVIPLLSDGQYQQVDVAFTLNAGKKLSGGTNLLLLPVPEHEVEASNITVYASDSDYQSLQFVSDNVEVGTMEFLLEKEVDWGLENVNNRMTGDFEVNADLLAEQQYWQAYRDRLQLLRDLDSGVASEIDLGNRPEAGFGYRDFQVLQSPGVRLTGHASGVLPQILVKAEMDTSSKLVWWQLGIISGLTVVSVCLYYLTERGWIANWVSHAPMSPFVLLGVVWWTFLTPAFIGIGLMLLGLFGLLLPDRRFIKVRFRWVGESQKNASQQS